MGISQQSTWNGHCAMLWKSQGQGGKYCASRKKQPPDLYAPIRRALRSHLIIDRITLSTVGVFTIYMMYMEFNRRSGNKTGIRAALARFFSRVDIRMAPGGLKERWTVASRHRHGDKQSAYQNSH